MQSQSFLTVLMRARLGVYESRLLMRIVERCQDLLPPKGFELVAYEVPGGWSYQFAFTLASLTTSHNYRYVKKACETLKDITIKSYDPDTGQWKMAGMITQARIDEQSGILRVEVADWLCKLIIDFRKGWRSYDLQNAMKIKNPFALRMYLLTCTQKDNLTLSIGYVRAFLLGEGSKAYPNNGDFVRHCIKPAAAELKKLGLNGFTYKTKKANGTAKSRIEKIIFTPVKRETKEVNISETRKEMAKQVPEKLLQYLTLQCGFTTRELNGKNLTTLSKFSSLPDWQYRFGSIITRWRRHRYGHGWLINAMKKEGEKANET